ncbi:T9SS type A sorting domain-containing protein [Gelidibacter gilvus]|uniref:T9SS type A sorting domain-containing protein n=1 Tax=Gelidibacter gilvus TaxID=59602 RepID=A0A4Q0XCV9_9FLAO|nr:T9SS type A sorting domain-containing protein [Gelidibacter gilvus]RXJ43792.1 T9SS type A sorting domain-containing protein [Gelidibacter gilvus]
MKKLLLFALFVNLTLVGFSQTTYTVNTTDDLPDANIDDSDCADANGNCTLRAAIENANKTSTKDIIAFNISGTAPFTIVITGSELPAITYPIIIDGRTQTGYAIKHMPLIEIDGSTLPIDNSGLRLFGLSNNSEIYGLSIGGFQRSAVAPYYTGGYGIDVRTQNTIVQSNYLGLKPDGTTLNRNEWGVFFLDSGNNKVGGTGAFEGNVVSGNYVGGVTFQGIGCSNNVVQGNLLGTDATGLLARGNNFNLQFIDAPNNIVGGNSPGARNVISAGVNSRFGVVEGASEDGTGMSISGVNSKNISIIGNYIGTDITGTKALPNTRGGILLLFGANNITIGGEGAGERNVISGNGFYSSGASFFGGIYFQGNVVSNTIKGNYIGVDATGNVALPNSTGIYIQIESNNNIIGGTTPSSRNIISGNKDDGISIRSSENNQIIGNYIGLNASGTGSIPNADGVRLYSTSTKNIIGGANPLERNIISGNSSAGIIALGGESHVIRNNYIGLNPSGNSVISNGLYGLGLGGDLTGTRVFENVISGNGTVSNSFASNVFIGAGRGVSFYSNKLGTLPDGNTSVSNMSHGLFLNNSRNNIIGGETALEGNIIGGHLKDGVLMLFESSNNIFSHNKIGVGADGSTSLGNAGVGINISGAILGGTITNNIIANNRRGVMIDPTIGIATQIAISENSIFNNSVIGIDLVGTTANDVGDADTGVNNLQNSPEVSSIKYLGSDKIEIKYEVTSAVTNSAYPLVIEFFGAVNGQGKFFISSDSYTAPGVKTVSIDLPSGYDPDDYNNIVATATDANGNTSEFGVNVSYTLSVSQFENQIVKLYPNPVSNRLYLQFPDSENYNLKLVNALGQVVLMKKNAASSLELDVSALTNGMYFLNVSSESRTSETLKFIKN